MDKMLEACKKCENVYMCILNDFKSCPKIEIATNGLGIPYKPKTDTEWTRNIPFSAHQSIKNIVNKYK